MSVTLQDILSAVLWFLQTDVRSEAIWLFVVQSMLEELPTLSTREKTTKWPPEAVRGLFKGFRRNQRCV